MSALVWKEIRAFEWVAADSTGKIVGKIVRSHSDNLHAVTFPLHIAAEYLTLDQAKAAIQTEANKS